MKGEGRFLVGDVKMLIMQMFGDKKDVVVNIIFGCISWGWNVVFVDVIFLILVVDKNLNLFKQFQVEVYEVC